MLKKSAGNMYDWVTHTHSHLAGKCPHECAYCYVQAMGKVYPVMKAKYSGPVRLIEEELLVDYGHGKTIFIEHMNDMFAEEVSGDLITKILHHCSVFFGNEYVFQTKNPLRAAKWLLGTDLVYKIGTTIESNRNYPEICKAPTPEMRRRGMMAFKGKAETFVTIEPIMDFDVSHLVAILTDIKPEFVNIGADSKRGKLPEPSPEKVKELIAKLGEAGIVIRKKTNLGRMLEARP